MDKNKYRKLSAIMFTDIEGYTSLMQSDENIAIELREKHRTVLEKCVSDFNGKILQYYGDGTLSTFNSAVEAVQCAIDIQKNLNTSPKIPVRAGIHLGDIVFQDDGIYGDGVNIASRVESLSISGAVLISDKVNDELGNHSDIRTKALGIYNLKNVSRPFGIFAVVDDLLNIPSPEQIRNKTGEVKKSIAVLPFVNMSADKENEYFSDGMTEEILNALAGVDGLQVTSRTSSFAFKNQNLDVRTIGKELNVKTVVEGSVRKAGNKVRITAQLINTSDGYHIWSEVYDRDLEDVFAVQDEISSKIANTLRKKLDLKDEVRGETQIESRNLEAYELYLKGRFHWYRWSVQS
jgi:TolB-like protein